MTCHNENRLMQGHGMPEEFEGISCQRDVRGV